MSILHESRARAEESYRGAMGMALSTDAPARDLAAIWATLAFDYTQALCTPALSPTDRERITLLRDRARRLAQAYAHAA